MRRAPFFLVGAAFASTLIGVGVLVPRDGGTAPGTRNVYSHEVLQRAAEMTRQMAVVNDSHPMFTGRVVDDQLRLSKDPRFVRELEAHMKAVDRMLGRGGT